MFPQNLRVVCWMDIRLVADRGGVVNVLLVLDAVGSAVLILALFN